MHNVTTIVFMFIAATLSGVVFHFFGAEGQHRVYLSYEDVVFAVLFSSVVVGIFHFVSTIFLFVPVLFAVRSLKLKRLSIYAFTGLILGMTSSVLLAVLLKAVEEDNCDSVCLDPGTYFPFVTALTVAGVLQGVLFYYGICRNDGKGNQAAVAESSSLSSK